MEASLAETPGQPGGVHAHAATAAVDQPIGRLGSEGMHARARDAGVLRSINISCLFQGVAWDMHQRIKDGLLPCTKALSLVSNMLESVPYSTTTRMMLSCSLISIL